MKAKRKTWKAVTIFMLIFTMTFSQTVYATGIQEAKNQKQVLEARKAQIEKSIRALEKDKKNIVTYIQKLDKRLNNLNAQVISLKGKIEVAEIDLRDIKADLKEAKETEQNQYDTMKKRIKYIYENGSQGYLEIILGSRSFSDLLNRVEYITKIQKYDNNLLEEYQKTKQLVAKKKTEQENKITDLKNMKAELAVEQAGVKKLVSKKTAQLKKKQSSIKSSKNKVSAYQREIANQEKKLEKLLAAERKKREAALKKQQAEEAAKKKQASASASSSSSSSSSSASGSSTSGGKGYRWPLDVGGTITSTFGYRNAPTAGASSYHKGLDIAVPVGTQVHAAAGGTVVTASYQAAAGNYIQISHGGGVYTVYMHLSSIGVSVGQTVSKGAVIGYSGSTGVSTGPHLHFGVNVNGSYVNPLNYVSRP